MKIRTYIAKDMRHALGLIRDEQGPDAVILSTRTVPGGVEVAAAVDMEAVKVDDAPPAFALQLSTAAAAAPAAVAAPAPAPAPAPAAPVPQAAEARDEVGAELRSMRSMLEAQLARLAWNDLTRRAPAQAELLKSLTELGLDAELSSELTAGIPPQMPFEEAQRRVLALLAHRLPVTGDVALEQGGRIAFVGPTGVGKTTAIAKLAARWVMQRGPRELALVSLDAQRFGAQEQLRVLGRLLGVECFTLEDAAALPSLLQRLGDRRLVLVDTAGLSPRDPELAARAEALLPAIEGAGARICLALSAAAQAGMLAEAARAFAVFRPAFCLLTKLDEATSLGGTLSLLARGDLPVSYVSEGQRIPEDLAPARAHQLVSRAVTLAREAGALAGEDLLTRRFGGIANAIA